MTPRQAGHGAVTGDPGVLARRAPHDGQYTAPSNIRAKQDGQLTVARVAWQYLQAGSPGAAGAPQFGQCNEAASAAIAQLE